MSIELTVSQQEYELRQEFYEEAEKFKSNRSPIERQMALQRIDGLLDEFLDIEVEYVGDEHGKGSE